MRDLSGVPRALAVAAVAAVAFASIWIGGSRILPQLRTIHEQYAHVSAHDADRTAGVSPATRARSSRWRSSASPV